MNPVRWLKLKWREREVPLRAFEPAPTICRSPLLQEATEHEPAFAYYGSGADLEYSPLLIRYVGFWQEFWKTAVLVLVMLLLFLPIALIG